MQYMQPWGGIYLDIDPASLAADYASECIVIRAPFLSLAPPVDERSAQDPDHNNLCGEASTAWALSSAGIPTTQEQVAAAIRANFGEGGVQGGTSAAELQWYCQTVGIVADTTTADVNAICDQFLPQGYAVLPLVWCTPQAVLCTEAESRAIRPGGVLHWPAMVPSLGGDDLEVLDG